MYAIGTNAVTAIGQGWTVHWAVLYTCADVLATRSPSRRERRRPAQLFPSASRQGLCTGGRAGLDGRHDRRRRFVKRYRWIAAVGARCAHCRLERIERLRRVERIGAGGPHQARGAHAAHGQLRAVGAPGARRGGACGERDQQIGRRQGAWAGPEAQPRRRGRPVHEHDRGHRRVSAPDAAAGRRLGRGHHRQRHRAGHDPPRRGGEDPAVPREVGEQRDPDPEQPLHVPHLPARCRHGRPVGRAARAAAGDHGASA